MECECVVRALSSKNKPVERSLGDDPGPGLLSRALRGLGAGHMRGIEPEKAPGLRIQSGCATVPFTRITYVHPCSNRRLHLAKNVNPVTTSSGRGLRPKEPQS